jgi:hypothetical protein
VLATDLLQSIISKAKDIGIPKRPINARYTTDFPIVQYVDDTLLMTEACPLQLFALKAILNTFAESTRLKVNYSKSRQYPINLSKERLSHLTETFQCQTGSIPLTYLGLPLSMN